MSKMKQVVGWGLNNELLGPSLKERGFGYAETDDLDKLKSFGADFILLDARKADVNERFSRELKNLQVPVLSFIDGDVNRDRLKRLRENGTHGYLPFDLPPEELILQIKAMLKADPDARTGESRSSRRVWFQQRVEFRVFNEVHHAWSTTLSETGIFLRTSLSFPLYSVIGLKFQLFGEEQPFECDGVVVRQEVEGETKGLGIMFQNLRGESVRRLESFFEIYS